MSLSAHCPHPISFANAAIDDVPGAFARGVAEVTLWRATNPMGMRAAGQDRASGRATACPDRGLNGDHRTVIFCGPRTVRIGYSMTVILCGPRTVRTH